MTTSSNEDEVALFLKWWARRCLMMDDTMDVTFVASELQLLTIGLRNRHLAFSNRDLRHHPLVVTLVDRLSSMTGVNRLRMESIEITAHWAGGNFDFDATKCVWMRDVNVSRMQVTPLLGTKGGEAHDPRCICLTCLDQVTNDQEEMQR